jgi:hypothetical protein
MTAAARRLFTPGLLKTCFRIRLPAHYLGRQQYWLGYPIQLTKAKELLWSTEYFTILQVGKHKTAIVERILGALDQEP